MNHFLALTIGPVYKTLEKAKTTRELWVGSFFLSKLMELCIDYEPLKEYLLSPQKVDKPTYGAGVYPDRSYWKLDNPLTKEELTTHKSKILEKLSEACENMLSVKELDEYLKMYWVQMSFKAEEWGKGDFLFKLNELLDGLELQETWQPRETFQIIKNLIAKGDKKEDKRPVYKWRNSSVQIGLFPYVIKENENNKEIQRFPSIMELATRYFLGRKGKSNDENWYKENVIDIISFNIKKLDEIDKDEAKSYTQKKQEKRNLDEDVIQKIKEEYNYEDKKEFFARHKYICIIQSDGDGVGSFLKNQVKNDIGKLKKFSTKLANFSIKGVEEVEKYGGMPIYAGGDDLLFFAPVMSKDEKESILDLIERLNKKFKTQFESEFTNPLENNLAQSFGVKIMYYKFPLAEGLKTAVHSLFHKAKNQPGKNYMAIEWEKHSGSSFNLGYKLDMESYCAFKKMLNVFLEDKSNFLHSVMYKLEDQNEIIQLIHSDTERLEVFFRENFNEVYTKYKSFFDNLGVLIHTTYHEYAHEPKEEIINRIYSSLKFIQFLKAEDHD